MKKIDFTLLRAFLYGLPIVILLAIFFYYYTGNENSASANSFLYQLYNLAGFMFGLWMLLSIYLGIRLMISGEFRESVLSKLTLIKERDEREVMLSGKAAKTTMLTTMAILIFFFCLSCFQVSVYNLPPEKAIDGKSKVVTLGLTFSLMEQNPVEYSKEVVQKQSIINYSGLPVSRSAIIFALILWQIIAYNYSIRRSMK